MERMLWTITEEVIFIFIKHKLCGILVCLFFLFEYQSSYSYINLVFTLLSLNLVICLGFTLKPHNLTRLEGKGPQEADLTRPKVCKTNQLSPEVRALKFHVCGPHWRCKSLWTHYKFRACLVV